MTSLVESTVRPKLASDISELNGNSSTKKQAAIDRRTILWRCLSALVFCCPLTARSPSPGSRYRKLKSPIIVPLKEVAESWRPFPFKALCSAPASPGEAATDTLLKGILLRLPPKTRDHSELKAFCLHCPHELCFVNFTEDTETVRLPPAIEIDHPLLVCPCHFSVFNPLADGNRITGPADRGLYRFRLEVRRTEVEIVEVEEGVLG